MYKRRKRACDCTACCGRDVSCATFYRHQERAKINSVYHDKDKLLTNEDPISSADNEAPDVMCNYDILHVPSEDIGYPCSIPDEKVHIRLDNVHESSSSRRGDVARPIVPIAMVNSPCAEPLTIPSLSQREFIDQKDNGPSEDIPIVVEDDDNYEDSVSSDSYIQKESAAINEPDERDNIARSEEGNDDSVYDDNGGEEDEDNCSYYSYTSENDEGNSDAPENEIMAAVHEHLSNAGIKAKVYNELNAREKEDLNNLCNYYADMFDLDADDQKEKFDARMNKVKTSLIQTASEERKGDEAIIDRGIADFLKGLNKIRSERAWSRDELESILKLTHNTLGAYVSKGVRSFPLTEYKFNQALLALGQHDGLVRGDKTSVCICGKTVYTGKAEKDTYCVECLKERKLSGTNDYYYHSLYDHYAKLYKDPRAVELMESW